MRAVMSDPDRVAASTITTPIDRPEMMRLRRGKSLPRARKPADPSVERSVLGRVDVIDAARHHRDRTAFGSESRFVGRAVDAPREAGDDDQSTGA
jgi:hypothetical protein